MSTVGRRFQFSIATLIALLTSSAGLFASAPWIGKKLEPLVQRWFGAEDLAIATPGAYCTLGDIAILPNASPAPQPWMPANVDPTLIEPTEDEVWKLD